MRRAAALLLLALAGCVLKPPPDRTELRDTGLTNAKIPAAWAAGAASGEVQNGWLTTFADERLRALVAEALAQNIDLRVAAARVEQAAGHVKVAGGELYPAVNLLARGGGKMGGDGSGINGVILSASWELDVWGRVRYGVRAVEDKYASAQADAEYARQSVAALTAKAWFLAAESSLQRALANEMVASSERLVTLADHRLRIGSGNELDVTLARASVQTFRDSARNLDLALTQSLRALESLLGRYPSATVDALKELPGLPPAIPAGLPSELLERRPDVLAAERRVAAAFNRVGEAQAARLPRIGLNVSGSDISSDLFVLAARSNPVWSAGLGLLVPLFQGGALKAQVEVRSAEQKEALAAYAQTGLKAFNEVEGALSGESTLRDRREILSLAAAENEKALRLEEARYRIGQRDLRTVSQQQLALFASRSALLRVQSEQFVQRINLHLALGGNFETPPAPDAPPAK
jgi:NodT family efflux transporter outer membrane factor (OMF) lipoprotein